MSWFDASGFANIAKSALREAQRTIDKALDIREDEANPVPANTPIDTNSDDFFGAWGVTQPERDNTSKDVQKPHGDGPRLPKLQSSLWGSFTGSFFDAHQEEAKSPSIDSLDDSMDTGNEHFSRSKLVVQQNDDSDQHFPSLPNTDNTEDSLSKMVEVNLGSPEHTAVAEPLSTSRHEKTANRLSVVSSGGSKNSSESVELITCSTECTTSPESDVLSVDHSISTSSSALGGTRHQTSESVEILVDSLTSPSSIEIISSDSIQDKLPLDEFASPLDSPIVDEEASPCVEKSTPDSIGVIPEDLEESIAEDTMSYTSISESTSATVLDQAFVHLKPQKMLKDTYITNLTENELSADATTITRAPSRSGGIMHLPLNPVNQVLLIDTQPQSNRQDLSNILKNSNIIDIPVDDAGAIESNDEGSQSDRTIIANKDGTTTMDSSSDTSMTDSGMNSMYLKNLIADAMTERVPDESLIGKDLSEMHGSSDEALETISISQLEMPPRRGTSSPVSSAESRSDMVKVGSDHTSGHTSGDELETTTSSDIEIISSPTNGGDSSSTQSRQSPAKQQICKNKLSTGDQCSSSNRVELLNKITMKKKTTKGHTRELSEASSISDDASEVDRLLKRLSEMSEILESRESKLIDMTRRNAELEEFNADMKNQLDAMFTKQLESADLSQVTEEYTQRLSALEKKFQQAIREKDTLRKQLEQCKQEAATRMSRSELELLIHEKDEVIEELRSEGEKLSKQQLQHSNIIKKLRGKEKENESTIKNLKETIEDLTLETERLKRSLAAKDEVERSQIEAIHQLTAKNKKSDSELAKLQSQHEDLTQKFETTKKSLEAAKKELTDKNRSSSELVAREQRFEVLQNEKRQTESQNAAIIGELEDLRAKLRESDLHYVRKEQALRKENADLIKRLENAEARNEELSQSILEVSKPLVRQLESLQATYTAKVANFERMEHELELKINELQSRLQTSLSSERIVKDESVSLRSKLSDLESELSTARHQNELLKMKLEQQTTERRISEQDLKSEIESLRERQKVDEQKYEELTKEMKTLQLTIEKLSATRKKSVQEPSSSSDRVSRSSQSNSPTLSIGKASVADSLSSSFWSQEEPFDVVNPSSRYTNMFEIQMLQTNLKQRDGELQQLQWELSRREQERALLNSEISTLLTRIDGLESRVGEYDALKRQFDETQQQYETLCQLYGEKVEENEELKLDLQDVKEMYKSQIDELLRQQKQNS